MPNSVISVYSGIVNFIPPSFEETSKLSIEKWGEDVGRVKPSFYPQSGDNFIVFGPAKGSMPDSHHCVKVGTDLGFNFPNVHGLVIVEDIDKALDFLPKGSFLMGFDYKEHLSFQKHSGHIVPCLEKNFDGEYRYLQLPWNSILDHDELMVLFRKRM